MPPQGPETRSGDCESPSSKSDSAASLPVLSSISAEIQIKFDHRIFFTENLFSAHNLLLRELLLAAPARQTPKALVVLDESLCQAQPELAGDIERYFGTFNGRCALVRAPLVLDGGERVKNTYFHISKIQSEIDRHNLDRHSYLIAVSGGALLDVAGLAAATAHRGIRHIRVPSTTLGQADSGVGIKNGINAFGKKNFIGSFAVPFAVINDFTLLKSLPAREMRAGFSEAVKVACIKDAAFFEWIESAASALANVERSAVKKLIRRSAELHVGHIAGSGDPFELGSARPLDFGHWSAHKLEQLSDYRIRHGEAVAIGIALDVVYSRRKRFLGEQEAERVLRLLENLGFELYANELFHTDTSDDLLVLSGLEEFRNHLGGELTITLMRRIGSGFEIHEMDEVVVADSIQELRQRHFNRPLRNAPGEHGENPK